MALGAARAPAGRSQVRKLQALDSLSLSLSLYQSVRSALWHRHRKDIAVRRIDDGSIRNSKQERERERRC